MDGCGRRARPVEFPVLLYWSLSWGRDGWGGGFCAGHTCLLQADLTTLTGPPPPPPPVPAMITSHPNTTIAIKGHAKELNCTARGERPIIIRWEKGDTVIDPDRVMRYAIATKDNGDEVVSTLKVSAPPQSWGTPTLREWGAHNYHICIREANGEPGSPSPHPKNVPPLSHLFPLSIQESLSQNFTVSPF